MKREQTTNKFYWYLHDERAVIRYITCYPKSNHINPGKFSMSNNTMTVQCLLNRRFMCCEIKHKKSKLKNKCYSFSYFQFWFNFMFGITVSVSFIKTDPHSRNGLIRIFKCLLVSVRQVERERETTELHWGRIQVNGQQQYKENVRIKYACAIPALYRIPFFKWIITRSFQFEIHFIHLNFFLFVNCHAIKNEFIVHLVVVH